jgi:hypothetical protein
MVLHMSGIPDICMCVIHAAISTIRVQQNVVKTVACRDVAPDNIAIGPDGRAKLLDLGVALRTSTAGHAEELHLRVTGKPLYRSLLLAKTKRHTLSTDLESLFYW